MDAAKPEQQRFDVSALVSVVSPTAALESGGPDGAEVRVALVDDDDLGDRERAKLHAAIPAGEAELDAGQAVSEGGPWSRMRAVR